MVREQVGGAKVVTVSADVTDLRQVERAVEDALGGLGHLDVLVNSAGVAALQPIDEMPPEQWRRVIDVNLIGVYHVTRAVWCHMKGRGSGSIVMISSGSGRRAHAGWSAYCASKFAVMGLADSLAKEGRRLGIRCNVIQPGITETPALAAIPGSDQMKAQAKMRNPFRRLTTPVDVANIIYLLSLDEAAWVNGAVIRVDGGEHISGVSE